MVFTVLGKPIKATLSYVLAFSFKGPVSIRVLALGLLSLVFTANAHAGQVTLAWDTNTDPELGGYKLYYGPNSGNYTGSVDVGNQTTCTLTGLADGQTYYFAVTDYDLLGQNESAFSNEVQATTPASINVPVVGFSATPTTGAAALNVAFTDTSTGLISNWNWNFGDGATSTTKNPSHIYSVPGTYSVGLTVTGTGGSNSVTKTNYITVAATAPGAGLSATPTTGAAALNVAFTDTSTGLITNWNWNFGDGTSSATKNPSHIYSVPGTYSVGLTVTGTGGSNSVSKTNYITVAIPAPTWTLTITSSNPASGVSVTVSPNDNSSQGSGASQFTRTYNNNAAVTLTAPATAGANNFSNWSGCDSSSGATCSVTMNANKTVTANFALTTFPDTNITSAPPALTNSTNASFSFTATEAGSTFECSLDGSAFTSCTSPASYSPLAGGIHTFRVRAINSFGNTDPTPASFTWTVDTIAPDTTITVNPPLTSSSANATFQFSATEANSTFECKLDGAGFAACTSAQNYTSLANGSHTVQVRAIDAVGNVDPSPASFTWTVAVDNIPPVVQSIVRSNANPTNASSVSWTVTFSENVTGVDAADFTLAGSIGASITSVAGANNLYTVSANSGTGSGTLGLSLVDDDSIKDAASNPLGGVGANNGNFTGEVYNIDKAAPDTNITSGPSGTITVNTATFQFTSTEANSTFECSLDGAAFSACTSGITYNSLANGNHNFQARAIDAVGNQDLTPASRAITVNVPSSNPTISLSYDGQIGDRVGQGEFALSADGKLDGGFTVTLNTGSGNRTVTRLQLTNTPGGVWNTQGGDGYWSLGAATSAASPLLNAANDAVTFAVAEGSSFKIFAADWQNAMYLNGVVFTLTANFSDGSSASASTTINAAALRVVTITVTSNAAEPATNGQFTVSRTGSSANAMTVNFTVGGTATQGTDYANIGTSVVIPAGSATVTIPVNVIDDSVYEGTETVIVTLNSNANYTVGNPNSATVNIADNEAPSAGPVLVESPSSVLQGGSITATWSGIVNPTATDWIGLYAVGTGNSSYLIWMYVSCSQAATVARGSGSCGLGIPGNLANGSYELRFLANDGFNVWAVSAPFTVGNVTSLPTVTITASVNAAEPATNGQFTVTRTGGTAAALTVNYTVGGTATNGADYQTLTGGVTLAAGASSATIDIVPVDDSLVEGSETVVLALVANAAYTVGVSASATVTIADNDLPSSNPTISLSYDGQIGDRVGQAEFALSADGKLDGGFTVTLNTGSGNRTVTRLQLTNTPGGVWNTQGGDGYWSLGAATSAASPLLNAANDSVNFAVAEAGSFKIFAADWQNAMYLNGVVFTLTANFSDGSSASASATIP